MQIWVDADACPKAIKEILFRAAHRTQVLVTLVANRGLATPPSPHIRMLQVPRGFDVADDEIVLRVSAGDLVVTGDIPLAAAVLARDAHAVTPRGEPFSKDTIAQQLQMRDMMESLRDSGVVTGGPAALSNSDLQAFARQLDKFLAVVLRVRASANVREE
jgi:uncharacterized protein